MWTASSARKQGIATKLLETARYFIILYWHGVLDLHYCRTRFVYGDELTRDHLAFSQPTDSGQKLAMSYFGRSDYLVYIEE